MIETKSMKNIHVIEIETRWMMKTRRVMIYKIASIIEMTDKISKNVMIEMIVWELTSFLNDEYRDFSTEMMMNHCINFLIFLKFLMIVMKMKTIVSENFSLLTIHEMSVYLMIDEMILWMIAAFLDRRIALNVLEMMIFELIANEILLIACEILLIVMILNVLNLIEMLVKNNLLNFVQNSFSRDE
jgi:hypothetical protein